MSCVFKTRKVYIISQIFIAKCQPTMHKSAIKTFENFAKHDKNCLNVILMSLPTQKPRKFYNLFINIGNGI